MGNSPSQETDPGVLKPNGHARRKSLGYNFKVDGNQPFACTDDHYQDASKPASHNRPKPSKGAKHTEEAKTFYKTATSEEARPAVFRWGHGGQKVYITGTFNGWRERIPLVQSQEDFTAIINLPPGVHHYKFIVDDEWRFNPDQPTMPDHVGVINNFIEVSSHADSLYLNESHFSEDHYHHQHHQSCKAFSVLEKATTLSPKVCDSGLCKTRLCKTRLCISGTANEAGDGAVSPPDGYTQEIPLMDRKARPPPMLPAHFGQVLLDCGPVSGHHDPSLLPIPNHVMLNHLYAMSIHDGVMVLGVTQRFRKKYVTTVLYNPLFSS